MNNKFINSIIFTICCLIFQCNTDKSPVKYALNSMYEDKIISHSINNDTHNIICINIDGSNSLTLINGTYRISSPQSSFDGKEILYLSARTEFHDSQLAVINNDGNNFRLITDDTLYVKSAKWSPINKTIAFIAQKNLDLSPYNIFTINQDGQFLKKLTNAIDEYIMSNFDWSPNSKKIVYNVISNFPWSYKINIINVDSLNIYNIVSSEWGLYYPMWSPDDKYIVYIEDPPGYPVEKSDLVRVNLDGSNKTKLTNIDGFILYPAISPDSKKIAFVSDRDGNFEIYSINIDGSDMRRLTNFHDIDTYPIWSPESDKIVYSSRNEDKYQIFIMNSDGTDKQLITSEIHDYSNFGSSWMRIKHN